MVPLHVLQFLDVYAPQPPRAPSDFALRPETLTCIAPEPYTLKQHEASTAKPPSATIGEGFGDPIGSLFVHHGFQTSLQRAFVVCS